jgi:hypothetical protein
MVTTDIYSYSILHDDALFHTQCFCRKAGHFPGPGSSGTRFTDLQLSPDRLSPALLILNKTMVIEYLKRFRVFTASCSLYADEYEKSYL